MVTSPTVDDVAQLAVGTSNSTELLIFSSAIHHVNHSAVLKGYALYDVSEFTRMNKCLVSSL